MIHLHTFMNILINVMQLASCNDIKPFEDHLSCVLAGQKVNTETFV